MIQRDLTNSDGRRRNLSFSFDSNHVNANGKRPGFLAKAGACLRLAGLIVGLLALTVVMLPVIIAIVIVLLIVAAIVLYRIRRALGKIRVAVNPDESTAANADVPLDPSLEITISRTTRSATSPISPDRTASRPPRTDS